MRIIRSRPWLRASGIGHRASGIPECNVMPENLAPSSVSDTMQSNFEQEVAARFGLVPNFFQTAKDAPGLIQELWGFAKSGYLDNPLPSLFKERLFVHLSRFCEVRYCIVRHVGFLIGHAHPGGDPRAVPNTVEQVVALLSKPAALSDDELAAAYARLARNVERSAQMAEQNNLSVQDLLRTSNGLNELAMGLKQEVGRLRL